MTYAKLVAIDTETTSLRPDRRAWDIALAVREPGQRDVKTHQWFVDADDLDLGNADLNSLKIGRFFERHPQARPDRAFDYSDVTCEQDMLCQVEAITRGAHILGGVPNFDTEVLGNRMRARGICPSWHYHLIDFEALIAGYISGRRHGAQSEDREWDNAFTDLMGLPWDPDELSKAVGVDPPGDEDRHTALGDALWAMRVWDAITKGP